LVPMFGGDVSGRALQRAARLAGDDALVDAVYVIEVPHQLSLASGMDEEEERGRAVLEGARERAGERKLKIRTSLLRTRNPGAALVEEARQRGPEVVYLDTSYAPGPGRPIGPTARSLPRKRPCRRPLETDARARRAW